MKETDETLQQIRERAAHTMLEIWPDVRAMVRTQKETATFERLTEAFQALLLADKIIEAPEDG